MQITDIWVKTSFSVHQRLWTVWLANWNGKCAYADGLEIFLAPMSSTSLISTETTYLDKLSNVDNQLHSIPLPTYADICLWRLRQVNTYMLDIHQMLLSKVTYSISYIHSCIDGGGCHARCWPAHQEQFWVQYLAQGHFNMQTMGIDILDLPGVLFLLFW